MCAPKKMKTLSLLTLMSFQIHKIFIHLWNTNGFWMKSERFLNSHKQQRHCNLKALKGNVSTLMLCAQNLISPSTTCYWTTLQFISSFRLTTRVKCFYISIIHPSFPSDFRANLMFRGRDMVRIKFVKSNVFLGSTKWVDPGLQLIMQNQNIRYRDAFISIDLVCISIKKTQHHTSQRCTALSPSWRTKHQGAVVCAPVVTLI